MVRRIDEAFLEDISKQAGNPVSLLPLSAAEVPVRLLLEAEEAGRPAEYRIEKDMVAGYLMVKDLSGVPIAAMKFLLPRQIYDQGRRTLLVFLAFFVTFCVGIIAIVLLLLDKAVLGRLARLSAEVQAMIQWVRMPASLRRLLRSKPTSAPSAADSSSRSRNSRLSYRVRVASGV